MLKPISIQLTPFPLATKSSGLHKMRKGKTPSRVIRVAGRNWKAKRCKIKERKILRMDNVKNGAKSEISALVE